MANLDFTALDKVAIVLMSMEVDRPGVTQSVFECLGEERSRDILKSMSKLESIDSDSTRPIIEDFHTLVTGNERIMGGQTLPNYIFQTTFQEQEKDSLFQEEQKLFHFFLDLSDDAIINYFNSESMQLVALVLKFLPDFRVAGILSLLPESKSIIIAELLLTIEIPNNDLIKELQDHIYAKLFDTQTATATEADPMFKFARSLEIMAPLQREAILSYFDKSKPELAKGIRCNMIFFEDLLNLSELDIQTWLYDISDLSKLAKSISILPEETQNKLTSQMSARFLLMLEDEVSNLDTDLPEKDAKAAQLELVVLARDLEKQGKITSIEKILEEKQKKKEVENGHQE